MLGLGALIGGGKGLWQGIKWAGGLAHSFFISKQNQKLEGMKQVTKMIEGRTTVLMSMVGWSGQLAKFLLICIQPICIYGSLVFLIWLFVEGYYDPLGGIADGHSGIWGGIKALQVLFADSALGYILTTIILFPFVGGNVMGIISKVRKTSPKYIDEKLKERAAILQEKKEAEKVEKEAEKEQMRKKKEGNPAEIIEKMAGVMKMAGSTRAPAFTTFAQELLVENGIDSKFEIAHFFSQCSVESNNFQTSTESARYRYPVALKVFGDKRMKGVEAWDGVADFETGKKLFNAVYGGKWGKKNLGNTKEGDGFNFRGRGFIQLTGRANYEEFETWVEGKAPYSLGNDFTFQLDFLSAVFFFVRRRKFYRFSKAQNILDVIAEVEGAEPLAQVKIITKYVNGGQMHLNKRLKMFNKLLESIE